MSFAAKAIMDAIAPPPPQARGSNAAASDDAPSFQDHVDAISQHEQGGEPSRSNTKPRSPADTASAQQQSEPQTSAQTKSQGASQDDKAQQASEQPPAILQLAAAIAPNVLHGKTTPQTPSQQDPTPVVNEPAKADASQTAVAVLATPKAPGTPKTEATASRGGHGKGKAETAKADALNPNEPTLQAQAEAQPASPQVPTTPALIVPQTGNKDVGTAKTDAIDGVQHAAARSAEPKQPAPSTPTPLAPQAAPTPAKSDASEAKNGEPAKAIAPADALKQAAKDFAPTATKTQAPAPPALAPHPQMAEPVQQAAREAGAQRSPVASQVGGEIIRRFNGGDTSFQLRLDPPELGRVDVRLDVSRDHRVTAVISADSPQALSDLARGARDLQQALQSAGLDISDDGLRFDLSSNGQGNAFAQAQAQQDQSNSRAANTAHSEASVAPEVTASRPLSIDSWRGARVDLVA